MRRRVGDLLAIPLPAGGYGFGWVLDEPLVAFFSLRSSTAALPEALIEQPVAFRVWTMNHPIKTGHWAVIGHAEPPPELRVAPRFFIQDPVTGALRETTDGGDAFPTTLERCYMLERAAVWESAHLESRLEDFLAGRPNRWIEAQRVEVGRVPGHGSPTP